MGSLVSVAIGRHELALAFDVPKPAAPGDTNYIRYDKHRLASGRLTSEEIAQDSRNPWPSVHSGRKSVFGVRSESLP